MNIEACIAVEGVETKDGRFIANGALTWDTLQPVYFLEKYPRAGWNSKRIIGTVERVWRTGALVVAEMRLDEGHGLSGQVSMCMEIDQIEMTSDDDLALGGRFMVTEGRLRAVTIHARTTAAVWPECVFTMPEEDK